jgi:hypothetical protein
MGREKSSKYKVLAIHISIIFLTLGFGMMYFLDPAEALMLSAINALTHAAIDWNIWRLYRVTVWLRHRKEAHVKGKEATVKRLQTEWEYWKDPVFGWFLGLDQLVHFIILYWIYS